ncbi:MAG: N-acetylmuramoyl-L-alanine amidase [Spartobacteria bacterium]
MAEGTPRIQATRKIVAWLGLLIMIASFAWLQLTTAPETSTTAQPSVGQAFPVVVIDPGHGGQDSGAMCGEVMEKDLTFDIARRLDRQLQAKGLATVLTRVGDSYISLAERAALTNRVPDCVFVSIHFNEGNKEVSTGVETYYADHQIAPGTPMVPWLPFLQRASTQAPNFESQSLAGLIQEALVAHTQAADRGTKPQQYFVIANVRHPAVLVEGGFLTNKDEAAKLGNEDYREQLAAAICDGIVHYRELIKQRPPALAAHNE